MQPNDLPGGLNKAMLHLKALLLPLEVDPNPAEIRETLRSLLTGPLNVGRVYARVSISSS